MHDEGYAERLSPHEYSLRDALRPIEVSFTSVEQLESLTEEQAMDIMRLARRRLLNLLIGQEYHEHMTDDCGDDLQAATENWWYLWKSYFDNDGTDYVGYVRNWLMNPDDEDCGPTLGGSDGEIRYDILTEALMEDLYWKGR